MANAISHGCYEAIRAGEQRLQQLGAVIAAAGLEVVAQDTVSTEQDLADLKTRLDAAAMSRMGTARILLVWLIVATLMALTAPLHKAVCHLVIMQVTDWNAAQRRAAIGRFGLTDVVYLLSIGALIGFMVMPMTAQSATGWPL